MKLEFEEWLNSQDFGSEVNELFEESITCYKASAYRASLLFSYLGFQTIIKERIISAKSVSSYKDGEWNEEKKSLSDDDKWDKLIFQYIVAKKKPIFNISHDLKNQYTYWRDRRNDCAHAKGNIISYPHVEGFWLFVQSNLGKFVVNGGMEMILQEIADHFNPVITPTGTLVNPIVHEISSTIELTDYEEFLIKFKEFTTNHAKSRLKIYSKDIVELWSELFSIQKSYREKLVSFLEQRPNFTIKLIRHNPKILQQFKNEKIFIRKLWKEEFSIPNDYKVFVSLIRYNLIPQDQHDEVFNHMFDNLDTIYFDQNSKSLEDEYLIDPLDEIVLIESNFYNKFKVLAFENEKIMSDFNRGNRNKELVVHYIKENTLDEVVVEKINEVFNRSYPPYRLMKELEMFYKDNSEKLTEHLEISTKIKSIVPEVIEDLYEEID